MRSTIILAATAALAACGSRPAGDTTTDTAEMNAEQASDAIADANSIQPVDNAASTAAGAGAQLSWSFGRSAAGPKLVYGEPETDNVRLMLRCAPGGSSVILSFMRASDVAESRPATLTVAAAGERREVEADRTASELGGTNIEAALAISSPPLQRFRGGAALELVWGEETISVPGAGATANRFFDACAAAGQDR